MPGDPRDLVTLLLQAVLRRLGVVLGRVEVGVQLLRGLDDLRLVAVVRERRYVEDVERRADLAQNRTDGSVHPVVEVLDELLGEQVEVGAARSGAGLRRQSLDVVGVGAAGRRGRLGLPDLLLRVADGGREVGGGVSVDELGELGGLPVQPFVAELQVVGALEHVVPTAVTRDVLGVGRVTDVGHDLDDHLLEAAVLHDVAEETEELVCFGLVPAEREELLSELLLRRGGARRRRGAESGDRGRGDGRCRCRQATTVLHLVDESAERLDGLQGAEPVVPTEVVDEDTEPLLSGVPELARVGRCLVAGLGAVDVGDVRADDTHGVSP